MSKIKHKIARYQVALNEPQNNILKEMMQEDAQTEISSFFGIVLVNEYKRRQEYKNKKPVGRPRKDDDEAEEITPDDDAYWINDLPKDKTFYNKSVGAKELYYLENRKIEMPPNN